MATSFVSEDELDDYLNMPDCPQCGSDDVVCTDTVNLGGGMVMKTYYCNKCGHTWSETIG